MCYILHIQAFHHLLLFLTPVQQHALRLCRFFATWDLNVTDEVEYDFQLLGIT